MAESQPPQIVEGATTGDVEDELPSKSSADDRKAAAALSSLDGPREDESAATSKNVDHEAVRKAMDRLAGTTAGQAKGGEKGKGGEAEKKEVKKVVKVDAADVALLVDTLELTKAKATELLKAEDGDVTRALKTFITV